MSTRTTETGDRFAGSELTVKDEGLNFLGTDAELILDLLEGHLRLRGRQLHERQDSDLLTQRLMRQTWYSDKRLYHHTPNRALGGS